MSERLSNEQPLSTPVVLFIFNRADLVREVIGSIRTARPRRLFIVADGPRNERERALCDAARAAVQVDWTCEVEALYSEVNLGCDLRIVSGIDWVFERCEEAIFLEDDCLPSSSFFPYCEALLARYRSDERVACVSGMNLYQGRLPGDSTYFFSRYGGTWGWATWKRAWLTFDERLDSWPSLVREGGLSDLFATQEERIFWSRVFAAQRANAQRPWDFSWLYSRLASGGLTAMPRRNLVANLGFRADATHTTQMPAVFDPVRSRHDEWNLRHPARVIASRVVDEHTFRVFNPFGWPGILLSGARRLLRRLRA